MINTRVLPSGRKVTEYTPVGASQNFTWGEATKGLRRMPPSIEIENNIIKCARELEKVRSYLGDKPIKIHSWYRPPIINKNVGGSSKSRHLFGDAVDMTCRGLDLKTTYILLNLYHQRGGLGSYKTHVHIDFRGRRARW